jgi:hypothetical protein
MNVKKLTLPHLLLYVVGALTWLASLDQSLVASVVGPGVAPYAARIITGAGVVLAALHQLGLLSTKKSDAVTTIAKVFVPLMLASMVLTGCAGGPKPVALPTLSTAQLQALTKQVCTALTTDLVLLEGPTGKALLPAATMTKVTTVIGPTITAVCSSGASIDVTSLQTLNNTVVPALIDLVGSVPAIPDQPEILAGLTLAQVALVPIVNQAIAAAQAASSSAPSSAPASSAPTTQVLDVPAQNKHFVLASVESPQVVGASSSLLLVTALKTLWHIDVSAPAAAAVTVLLHG